MRLEGQGTVRSLKISGSWRTWGVSWDKEEPLRIEAGQCMVRIGLQKYHQIAKEICISELWGLLRELDALLGVIATSESSRKQLILQWVLHSHTRATAQMTEAKEESFHPHVNDDVLDILVISVDSVLSFDNRARWCVEKIIKCK